MKSREINERVRESTCPLGGTGAGVRVVGTAGSYLHAPDRMPEDPGTILRGVRLRGPGLRRVLTHARSPRGSNCDWIRPRARQDRVLRLAGIASGPTATVREGVKSQAAENGPEGLFSLCTGRG